MADFTSDHLPLLIEIDEHLWLGTAVQSTCRELRPIPETCFPPDRWFIQNAAERQAVLKEVSSTGELPRKMEYDAWTEAVLLNDDALQSFVDLAASAREAPSTEKIAAAYRACLDVGRPPNPRRSRNAARPEPSPPERRASLPTAPITRPLSS